SVLSGEAKGCPGVLTHGTDDIIDRAPFSLFPLIQGSCQESRIQFERIKYQEDFVNLRQEE
ncbi:MAG: hypothetical protein QGH41_13695, partial [Roseibacillus sp.]|nr:hypothetical protein [Roseibacillus sp.]